MLRKEKKTFRKMGKMGFSERKENDFEQIPVFFSEFVQDGRGERMLTK